MKYYVASRASLPERPKMWKAFRNLGFEIVSTWIDADGTGVDVNFPELWSNILEEIRSCDILVFYAEAQDFPFEGAMVEIGMALALDKKVYIVMPDVELEGLTLGSWCMHPNVEFKNDLKEAFGLWF